MKKLTTKIGALLLFLWLIPQSVSAAQLLIPVGQLIGLELGDNTVTVAAFEEKTGKSCQEAGLQVGDRLVAIDGKAITCTEDVRQALKRSEGVVEVDVQRGEKNKKLRLTPEITTDGPKLGVYLRQGVTGVGTVTFYNPDTGEFGALGHGVNDRSGGLLNMVEGKVYEASVLSVKKGKAGTPGQLLGALKGEAPIGTLSKNTEQGVFGTVDTGWLGQELPVAEPGEVKAGPAVIRSTVQGETVQEYSVEILKIYPNAKAAGRNLMLKVTDPALLAATGGIVQGMSGSPIIQDGHLVGAVTHVLVNDPTTGYGIFIENMLDAAG